MPQSTSTTPQQPSPFAAPWPNGVIARYLTLAGATVDLRGGLSDTTSSCTGCGEYEYPNSESYVRRRAQAHAEVCRALPRPKAHA
ncbi:hypothetical protein [Streptomyces sp. NPDC053367]|uniref:hypothetical protein n=1 Tax=Streptomyces sp. NPDC053367 TaxID=3365700 RepID=UPI0037D899D0